MPRAPQELRTYFVTTVTFNRRRVFQIEQNAELFLQTLQANRSKNRLHVHAYVVMPDHVHLLVTPAADISLEKAMQFLKGGFSFLLKSKLPVWQEGYREIRVARWEQFDNYRRYVEENPVRARLVAHAGEFRFSSVHGDVVFPGAEAPGSSQLRHPIDRDTSAGDASREASVSDGSEGDASKKGEILASEAQNDALAAFVEGEDA